MLSSPWILCINIHSSIPYTIKGIGTLSKGESKVKDAKYFKNNTGITNMSIETPHWSKQVIKSVVSDKLS